MSNVKEIKLPEEKVQMQIVGIDGNAFSIMGHFSKNARRQGWTNEQVNYVLKEMKSGDYNHLLCTLMKHAEEIDD